MKLKKRKVVEHNDLISSVAKMDKTPLKFLNWQYLILIRIIHQRQYYYLSKELFKFFEVSDNDKHSRFKKAIEIMQKQAFFKSEKKELGIEYESIVPIPMLNGLIIMMKL
jgi:plasmid replication initiation protein